MIKIDIDKYQSAVAPLKKEKENGKSWLATILTKDISLFGNQLSDKKKERIYSELSILFSAGVDIKTALEIIEEQQKKKTDRELIKTIKEDVINGKTLSSSLQENEKFSPFEYYSLEIGEESGRIAEVFEELSFYFSRKIAQKRQFVSAISYPVVVMCTAFGAIFFMLRFIVPMFEDVFKRFHTDLPGLTKLIISLSDFAGRYFFLFLIIVIGIFSFLYSIRKKDAYRRISSTIIIKIPLFGDIIKKVYLARFCQSMNLLMASRTPLLTAMDLLKKMIGFYPIESSLTIIQADILKGGSLHGSMAKFKIYPPRMISLVKVAEEVNQLDMIFSKLAKQMNDEVTHQSSLIGSLVEPIMIVFLGALVAIILIAMYIPLFQLSSSVH